MTALIARPIVISLLGLALAVVAEAECVMPESGRAIKITTQECRPISPTLDNTIKEKAGPLWETWNLAKFYTGALITDTGGGKWIYPTENPKPCEAFPIAATVEKAAYEACCDTGSWGKCVFGGKFLGELGGRPLNSFQ